MSLILASLPESFISNKKGMGYDHHIHSDVKYKYKNMIFLNTLAEVSKLLTNECT